MIRTFFFITLIFFTFSSTALENTHQQTDPPKVKKKAYTVVPIDDDSRERAPIILESGRRDYSNVQCWNLPLCVLIKGPDGERGGYSPLEDCLREQEAKSSFMNSKDKLNWLWSKLRAAFSH